MSSAVAHRVLWVGSAAVVQYVIWLLTVPDLWDPAPGAIATWLVLEAAAAVVIWAIVSERALVVPAVVAGWLLQAVHFTVTTPKDDDHNLWGVGLVVFAFLGAVALGVAGTVRTLTRRVRRRPPG